MLKTLLFVIGAMCVLAGILMLAGAPDKVHKIAGIGLILSGAVVCTVTRR